MAQLKRNNLNFCILICYKRFLLFFFLVFSGINVNAQAIVIDNSGFFYQVAPLYGFKQSVVSLTFDDGSVNQCKIALLF